MVKKKRKAKQKRTTDTHATVTGPVSVEESPLYIDIATPGTPTSADRYRSVPRQDVQDLGTAQPGIGMVSGSIIGLTSGEIRIDHDAALSVHFEGDRARKNPSIVVSGEDAIMEEPDVYGQRATDSDPEGPTPAPHSHAVRRRSQEAGETRESDDADASGDVPIDDLGPSLPAEEKPTPAPVVATPAEKSRRRRNTLPQHTRTGEHPVVAADPGPQARAASVPGPQAVVSHPMEPIVSGEITVVSGEIMIVPEEDIPARPRKETAPPPPPVAPRAPVAPPPLPVAGRPAEAATTAVAKRADALPPPPPPPGVVPVPVDESAGPAEPSRPDDEPSPEEMEQRQAARDQRREILRQMIAQAPVPFAMNIPDKAAPASDAGFVPAVPLERLEPQVTRPMVEAAGEVTAPSAPPEPPPPPPESAPAARSPRHAHAARDNKHPRHAPPAEAPAVPGNPVAAAEPPAVAAPAVQSAAPAAQSAAPAVQSAAPGTPVAVSESGTGAEHSRQRRVATPLENSLVSHNLEKMPEQALAGRLPRAATRDDLPTKFSDLEEEFFDKELHPENDYSGLDEVFANMQEQNQTNGSILNSIKRLFVADSPPPKNGGARKSTPAPKPAPKKPKGGHAPKKK